MTPVAEALHFLMIFTQQMGSDDCLPDSVRAIGATTTDTLLPSLPDLQRVLLMRTALQHSKNQHNKTVGVDTELLSSR